MVAVQTLKGVCTRRKSPSGLIALLVLRRKFLSSMESLAHQEIGFNPVVFEILAFLKKTIGNQLRRVPRDTPFRARVLASFRQAQMFGIPCW